MFVKGLQFDDSGYPSAVKTAEEVARRAAGLEQLEIALRQVAEEALRFYARRHPRRRAIELAEIFLAGVAWGVGESTGLWPSADLQDRWILEAAKAIDEEMARAARAHIHKEEMLAARDREAIREEIAARTGKSPGEVEPEEIDGFLVDLLRGAIEDLREDLRKLDEEL